MNDVIIRIEHVRAARLCTRGVRAWMKIRGFDYVDFLKNGIDANTIEATNDPLALRMVEIARGSSNKER